MTLYEIENTLKTAKFARDVKRYLHLIDNLYKIDTTKDLIFQRIYNGFFQLRRNEAYRVKHFEFLERNKHNVNISFQTILQFLSSIQNSIEASFATKMLSTINPNMPVWDRKVLIKLSLKKPNANSPTRLQETLQTYDNICKWYKEFFNLKTCNQWLNLFDKYHPNTKINPVKKVDFILWQMD